MFTLTNLIKTVLGLAGALVFFLIGSWAAQALYTVGGDVETAGMSDAPGGLIGGEAAAPAAPVDVIAMGEGDPAAGAKVFNKCKACHKVNGTNGVGPHLDGVVNRPVGSVEGFNYSAALQNHGGSWDYAALDAWLSDPKAYAPGNKMTFAGLKKAEDRANVVAYLESLQ
ncbi:cytochrome c family protein [Thioclava sp. 'Guangxiensis']|uniref:c-type cytochrome n=1 Tax=Thioclava sp. 'Guangxiensis' TaxID=3149044 RepID=UPI003877DD80